MWNLGIFPDTLLKHSLAVAELIALSKVQTVCPCTRELTLLAGLIYSQSWILAIFHQRTPIVMNCIPAVLPKFLLFTMAHVCCPAWVDGGRQILKHALSNINAAQLVIHYCWLSKAACVRSVNVPGFFFLISPDRTAWLGQRLFVAKGKITCLKHKAQVLDIRSHKETL